jgi:hypothetical protein
VETIPNAGNPPFYRSQIHRQRQVGRTRTAISYVDSDLEGRHPVVVRCDGSFFSSSQLIAGFDRSIFPISFSQIFENRKSAISYRYRYGCLVSESQRAFRIVGVMQPRRPTRVRRLEVLDCCLSRRILWTVRTVHEVFEAISRVSNPCASKVLIEYAAQYPVAAPWLWLTRKPRTW